MSVTLVMEVESSMRQSEITHWDIKRIRQDYRTKYELQRL